MIVLVTGGFDPLHSGHISYFEEARKQGDKLVVGLNSDEWLTNKKGRPFMPFEERKAVLASIRFIDEVIPFNDEDGTAIDAIKQLLDIYPEDTICFANGGDRKVGNVPEEHHFVQEPRVMMTYGVGGSNKQNSSSWILDEWKAPKTIRQWGWYRVLEDVKGYKVKELVILPGKSLSMQKHKYRNEHWYLLKGSCIIDRKDGVVETIGTAQTTYIYRNQWHKAMNMTQTPCHVLEVQYGDICEEWDIERDNVYDSSPSIPNYYTEKYSAKKS